MGRGLESKTALAAFSSRRGDQILYALADPSAGEPRADSFSASADGTGQPTKLPFPDGFTVAQDVSPDGRYLLATHATRGQTQHVWYLRTDRTESAGPVDFSQNAETERTPSLAPNGRYLAYTSTIGVAATCMCGRFARPRPLADILERRRRSAVGP
jgi:Tol biopolymer transport system component